MWSDKSTQSIVQEGKRLALVRCSGVMIWVWGDFLQAGRWGAAESGQDKSHLRGCMKSSEDSTEECRPKLSALGAARMIPSFLEIDRSATVRTATVNKDGEMERHIHEVIQHTVGGITIGMMWGAYKGSVDNAHLRHQYAEFRDSRQPYRCVFVWAVHWPPPSTLCNRKAKDFPRGSEDVPSSAKISPGELSHAQHCKPNSI